LSIYNPERDGEAAFRFDVDTGAGRNMAGRGVRAAASEAADYRRTGHW
jgi:hypothetical protein